MLIISLSKKKFDKFSINNLHNLINICLKHDVSPSPSLLQ